MLLQSRALEDDDYLKGHAHCDAPSVRPLLSILYDESACPRSKSMHVWHENAGAVTKATALSSCFIAH